MSDNTVTNVEIIQDDSFLLQDNQFSEMASIIKKTWKELMSNKVEVGQNIYFQVVTKDISMSRLFMKSKTDTYTTSFMEMLNTVVGFLDDRTTMDMKLEDLGRIHARNYGVKTKHYKHFRTAFMKGIRTYIPWNNRRENAWLWFWNHIIAIMSIHSYNGDRPLSNNLPRNKNIEYVAAVHESFDNAIDQSSLEFVKQFYDLLLSEQPDVARLFSSMSECKHFNARFVAMLRYTIGLLDDQQGFQKQIISLISKYQNYNINERQLQVLARTFIHALKQSNGDQWKSIYDESWEWVSQLTIEIFAMYSQNSKINK